MPVVPAASRCWRPALLAAWPALAADVTPERLANPDKEPQNWLMNHRSYDAQRFSPLARINKDNVKSLKLAYAVALGGTSTNENLQATPLVEDGFMYIVDLWGIVYKIDVRSGDDRPHRLAHGPQAGALAALSNRGAALWGNLVISAANYPAARDRDRQGHRQDRSGRRTSPTGRPTCSSPRRRSRSRTRSSSARPAATAACATGSPASTPRPASSSGANT